MKSYSSREVIKILKRDGCYEVGCDGDHHPFKHSTKKGGVIYERKIYICSSFNI